jgi:tetratricopeptide (TPR) repeat protein
MGYRFDGDLIIPEAYEIAKRAVSLEEKSEYAHWTLGIIQFFRGKYDLAISELNRAIDLNPNCALAYGALGDFLSMRNPEESIRNNEIAIRSNPKDPSIFFRYSGIAIAHFTAGRYSEASQWARKSVQRKPSWRLGHAVLASSLAQLNLLEEARDALGSYLENFPNEKISELGKVFNLRWFVNAQQFAEGLRKAGLPE